MTQRVRGSKSLGKKDKGENHSKVEREESEREIESGFREYTIILQKATQNPWPEYVALSYTESGHF